MKKLNTVILGASGSIGNSALDLMALHPQRYALAGISAYSDVATMKALIERYQPVRAVMVEEKAHQELLDWATSAGVKTDILCGEEALCDMVADAEIDVVIAAIVGVAGLKPMLTAVCHGKRVLLANKEALVCAGPMVMSAAKEHGAEILPVDSEHIGVFQCMHGDAEARAVRRIVLTASGGPLRLNDSDFASITPEQACAHPVWSMGRKISVDSATLMNKGLEVIEAAYLFDKSSDEIDTVIHPQGVIHALVEFDDGNMLAQLARPDMRTALAVALAWPERIASGVEPLDLLTVGSLEFMEPDDKKFPCLGLARAALIQGGDAPAAINVANEVAVEAFLVGTLGFNHIPTVVEAALADAQGCAIENLDDLADVDKRTRAMAHERIEQLCGNAREKVSL